MSDPRQVLQSLLDDGVREGVFPAAQASVWHRGQCLFEGSAGAAGTQTVFDLASLTKVVGTTASYLALRGAGALTSGTRLRALLPGAHAPTLTLEDLLYHRSGLPAWQPYFALPAAMPAIFAAGERPAAFLDARRAVVSAALACAPDVPVATRALYSDVGFILLGEALAAATGLTLDRLFSDTVGKPLGLAASYRRISLARRPGASSAEGTTRPGTPGAHPGEADLEHGRGDSDAQPASAPPALAPGSGQPGRPSSAASVAGPEASASNGAPSSLTPGAEPLPSGSAPGLGSPASAAVEAAALAPTGTERPRPPAPGQEGLWSMPAQSSRDGEVDDDNAWAMDGVAGHAGLFSTAEDVARFGQLVLEELQGARRLAPPELWLQALERDPVTPGSERALGFDTASPTGSSGGRFMSARAVGHLGFTGCSLWIDPERELVVSLLSNRVLTGRSNQAIRAFRPRFHDCVATLLPSPSRHV